MHTCSECERDSGEEEKEEEEQEKARPHVCGRSQSEQGRVGGRVNHQALPFFSYRQERHYDLKGGGGGLGA